MVILMIIELKIQRIGISHMMAWNSRVILSVKQGLIVILTLATYLKLPLLLLQLFLSVTVIFENYDSKSQEYKE